MLFSISQVCYLFCSVFTSFANLKVYEGYANRSIFSFSIWKKFGPNNMLISPLKFAPAPCSEYNMKLGTQFNCNFKVVVALSCFNTACDRCCKIVLMSTFHCFRDTNPGSIPLPLPVYINNTFSGIFFKIFIGKYICSNHVFSWPKIP